MGSVQRNSWVWQALEELDTSTVNVNNINKNLKQATQLGLLGEAEKGWSLSLSIYPAATHSSD